jgi:hypothetical protein
MAVGLAVAASGCSDGPVTPTGVPRAVIAVTVTPNPIAAVETSVVPPVFFVMWTVNIQETAGQGGEVQEVRASLFDDVTGALVAVITYDSDDLTVFVGENRVEANGTLNVPQQLSYTLPDGRHVANLAITVKLRDDNGNDIDQAFLVKIT